MFMQVLEVPRLWRASKIDFVSSLTQMQRIVNVFQAIWMVAFIATVSWDVRGGLLVAVTFALFTTVIRSQR
jgi:hypothetical protein